ncbi:MAG TPA: hypothetical protein VHL12_03350 [Gemmatimonadaceae bacterium]|jgi:hypothetical protein|nr:hypothetical protein [Gemmatimonadaceae bacterium]
MKFALLLCAAVAGCAHPVLERRVDSPPPTASTPATPTIELPLLLATDVTTCERWDPVVRIKLTIDL